MTAEAARRLAAGRCSVAVAESCTGGLICKFLTDVSGSSSYFAGGIVAYSNKVKSRDLGVDEEVLRDQGAVSEETARRMAAGIRERFGTDVGLSSTGIAGPDGGSADKPVGLVYLGVATESGTRVERFVFDGDRDEVRSRSAEEALRMLCEALEATGANHGQKETGRENVPD
ncbi:MAG: CinA family protein [Lentisphaerae bacterium]|nr:CinA family protein [Lentisphaerota bacterium]